MHCNRCNKDFETTVQLKHHIELYHTNVYFHVCSVCDKGLHSLTGLREHMKVHKGSKIKCDKCDKSFTTDRAKTHGTCVTYMARRKISNVNIVAMYLIHPPHCTCTSKAALRIHTEFHCTVSYVQKGHGTQGLKCWNTKGKTTIGNNCIASVVTASLPIVMSLA